MRNCPTTSLTPNVTWALKVVCPDPGCGAPIGVPCHGRPRSQPHLVRVKAAELARLKEWNRLCRAG